MPQTVFEPTSCAAKYPNGRTVTPTPADVPVCPVGIAGTGQALGRGAWFLRPTKVRVLFGEPILPDRIREALKEGDETLLALIRERLQACMEQASSWRAGRSPPRIQDIAVTAFPLV